MLNDKKKKKKRCEVEVMIIEKCSLFYFIIFIIEKIVDKILKFGF